MNNIIMGILLNICWFLFIRSNIKLTHWSTKHLGGIFGERSVKFDENAFDILKELLKKKVVTVNVPLASNGYLYATTLSGFFAFLGFIQSLIEFIVLPISFFFSLYNWGVPITVFIFYCVYLYICIKIGKIFVCRKVLKDAETFKFAYEGMIIRLEFTKFITVSYPDEWVDTILKWNSWMEKIEIEGKKFKHNE